MTCKSCGRKPEDGTATHWLGCEVLSLKAKAAEAKQAPPASADACEHGECSNLKRPQGKGPRPKYCGEHSDPKNRK